LNHSYEGELSKTETYHNYVKALLEMTGANKALSDEKCHWIIGYAAALSS
jgi:hypothetical protein